MKKFATLLTLLMLTVLSLQAQDKKTGYYENGKKKWEGAVEGKDTKVGEWTFYHDNGQVQRQGSYQNGKPIGKWKEFYRTGGKKSEGAYVQKNGEALKHGDWVFYHINGAKHKEGKYVGGKPVGTWFEYNKLGIQINKVEM